MAVFHGSQINDAATGTAFDLDERVSLAAIPLMRSASVPYFAIALMCVTCGFMVLRPS